MYTDKKRKRWPIIAAIILIAVLAVGIYSWVDRVSNRDVAEESAEALKAAVERSALQCYVVEGIYPPDLEYLEEHYGLQVNHSAFYISYDVFASNIPPDVRVTPKEGS